MLSLHFRRSRMVAPFKGVTVTQDKRVTRLKSRGVSLTVECPRRLWAAGE